jgi:hypothetical protein
MTNWQLVLGREFIVSKKVHLHLVYSQNSIFVKPIPECLLHHGIFERIRHTTL